MLYPASLIVQKAKTIYANKDKWTYCQGGLGELGESDRIKSLYNYYYSQPNKSKYMTLTYRDWLAQYGKGRQCTDCSNFFNVLLGYQTNYYSVWRISTCEEWKGELKNAPAGAALWMNGHVGLALGNGKFMDFPHYNETCRVADIEGALWEKAYLLPEIDYHYDEIDYLEVQVTEKDRIVGDSLSYDDFIVTNVYKDGSKKVNTGYNYTPGIITYDKCQIAIVYGDFVQYTTVKARRDGSFYAVMVPANDANDALAIQQKMIAEGFSNTACVRI